MGHIAILRPNLPNFDAIFKYWIWRLKINKLDLIWGPNFIVLRIYFIFGTKFSWNEGIDTCFNVECVLLGRNFGFFGGYFVVNARCLVVTARYRSLLLVPTFSMNEFYCNLKNVCKVHVLQNVPWRYIQFSTCSTLFNAPLWCEMFNLKIAR